MGYDISQSTSNPRRRFRDYGLSVGSLSTGPMNAITDVPGVLVGHSTIIEGEGPLIPGKGPVRTGVTVVRPHPGNLFREKVRGGRTHNKWFWKGNGYCANTGTWYYRDTDCFNQHFQRRFSVG